MIDEEAVRKLMAIADLRLNDQRIALVTPQLRLWLQAAFELNDKMRGPEHSAVAPITTFVHPASPEEME
jgi:hypothetical protein